MRFTSACILGTALISAAACAQRRNAPTIAPAPTPGAALERSMQAFADGDEAAYRRATVIESPHGYSEAYTRWAFASFRLQEAVRAHGVTGRRVRDAGWDRNETLSPGIAEPLPPEQWNVMRANVRKIQWKIDGDAAEPVTGPIAEGSTAGKTSVRRTGGGWVVVLSDPVDSAPAEHLRQFAQGWTAHATAIDAAAEKVKAGELRTIADVNDFLDAVRKKSGG